MATDVLISFDTTGSMYPCISVVRQNVTSLVGDLFRQVPDLRVGIIAHGDYIDRLKTYVTETLPFTYNQREIERFVRGVNRTWGGDAPECYELVIHEAAQLDWRDGANKAFVMIGDDVPHKPNYEGGRHNGRPFPGNVLHLDWKQEITNLGVPIYAVHCMPDVRDHSRRFYEEAAQLSNGYKLSLDQFREVLQLLTSIFLHQVSEAAVEEYGQSLLDSGQLTRGIASFIETLTSGRGTFHKVSAKALKRTDSLIPVPASRFQMLDIAADKAIRDFVEEMGAVFATGRGFYELTKPETIQERKEVVLRDRRTGDMFSGHEARNLIGLPYGQRGRVSPRTVPYGTRQHYQVFVQSTSYNRKLRAGQQFLYEAK